MSGGEKGQVRKRLTEKPVRWLPPGQSAKLTNFEMMMLRRKGKRIKPAFVLGETLSFLFFTDALFVSTRSIWSLRSRHGSWLPPGWTAKLTDIVMITLRSKAIVLGKALHFCVANNHGMMSVMSVYFSVLSTWTVAPMGSSARPTIFEVMIIGGRAEESSPHFTYCLAFCLLPDPKRIGCCCGSHESGCCTLKCGALSEDDPLYMQRTG
jgi:hypothetical protein